MQINAINNSVIKHRNNQKNENDAPPSFKGEGGLLMSLSKPLQKFDANPILGVIFLDVISAIAPNTIIDTIDRNPVQGFETFRRESSGLVINCLLPGLLVGAAAWAAKGAVLGDEFKDLNAHKIYAGKDTLEASADIWKKTSKGKSKEEQLKEFIHMSFDERIKPNSQSRMALDIDKTEIIKQKNNAVDELAKAIIETSKDKKGKFGIENKTLNDLHQKLATIYGQSKGLEVKKADGKTFTTGMKNYIRDTYALGKTFLDEKVTHGNIDTLASKLKKLNRVKSIITMAGVGTLALSMQAINRKITEKTSGRKGYSGYKDLSISNEDIEENKKKLSVGKLLSSAWFTSLAFVSMGRPNKSTWDFAAPTTTMNQARTLSLATDVGRVNAADDKNELKDTTARDTVIFMNLYVLGDYVQKGVVELAQKLHKNKTGEDLNLMNESQKINKDDNLFKKIGKWVKGKSIKSFEEIEGTTTKENAKNLLLRKKIVTGANLAGIGYSLVALGIFTPIMIAKMTNKNREKQLAKLNVTPPAATQDDSKKSDTIASKSTSTKKDDGEKKTAKLFDNFKN
ncbi:MAG: hypothetical protein PHE78_02415 [Candidatus Gastranaerophilales bacterium]|nr:hypothetical protein [Candidatus Gastranaerophilales bacterium]